MGERGEELVGADAEAEGEEPGQTAAGLRLQVLWFGCAGFLVLAGVGASAYGFAAGASAAIPTLLVGVVVSLQSQHDQVGPDLDVETVDGTAAAAVDPVGEA